MPRLGTSCDLSGDGRTIRRGGYGLYYDQPLVGIFQQNAFQMPPFNTVSLRNPLSSDPRPASRRTRGAD